MTISLIQKTERIFLQNSVDMRMNCIKTLLQVFLIEDIMRIRSEIWRVLPAWLWWIWMILNFITIPMDMMQVIKH